MHITFPMGILIMCHERWVHLFLLKKNDYCLIDSVSFSLCVFFLFYFFVNKKNMWFFFKKKFLTIRIRKVGLLFIREDKLWRVKVSIYYRTWITISIPIGSFEFICMKYPVTLNLVKIMEGRRGEEPEYEVGMEEGKLRNETKRDWMMNPQNWINVLVLESICVICVSIWEIEKSKFSLILFLFSYVSPVIILGYT